MEAPSNSILSLIMHVPLGVMFGAKPSHFQWFRVVIMMSLNATVPIGKPNCTTAHLARLREQFAFCNCLQSCRTNPSFHLENSPFFIPSFLLFLGVFPPSFLQFLVVLNDHPRAPKAIIDSVSFKGTVNCLSSNPEKRRNFSHRTACIIKRCCLCQVDFPLVAPSYVLSHGVPT